MIDDVLPQHKRSHWLRLIDFCRLLTQPRGTTISFSSKWSLRDRSIFMGIWDREICNRTTGYFGPLVERGHRLFWGLALRGHGLFQCRISTGPKIILKYSGAGSWTIFSFSGSFSYKKYGTRANLYYGTKIYFGRRFQRGRGKFLTKRIRGHTLFCMVKSTGPR